MDKLLDIHERYKYAIAGAVSLMLVYGIANLELFSFNWWLFTLAFWTHGISLWRHMSSTPKSQKSMDFDVFMDTAAAIKEAKEREYKDDGDVLLINKYEYKNKPRKIEVVIRRPDD